MKKSVAAFVLVGVILSSCGFHTCPTYAKKVQKKAAPSRETRI
ncbi:hypothetical protein [Ohtaekwangia sp.]